jgi:rfaE bifunctional protein kinase chain/domain
MTTKRSLLKERLISILRRFPQRKILVVGDTVADQFVYGAISRVSREAPVFILEHERTETVPGGAANCASNLAALGVGVSLISVVGKDEAGQALSRSFEASGIEHRGVLSAEGMRTTTKVRILAGQLHSTRQQVIRIDYQSEPLSDPALRKSIISQISKQASAVDAVIISDYNYGIVDQQTAEAIRHATGSHNIPVFVDSRFRLSELEGFTAATPNEDEVEHLLGQKIMGIADLTTIAERLRDELDYRALLVTRGSHGMTLFEAGVEPLSLAAIGAQEPVDVTGAGDTVIATFATAIASDASFPDAARLANYAGGIVVMKRGTASASRDELEDAIRHSEVE